MTEHSRLLAAWHARRSGDLCSHLDVHGPLPMPSPTDTGWPERLAELLSDARLEGRGGASFPSDTKLKTLRSHGGAATLVVNAMEGEPASMKDRVLLSCAPHLVLDGAQLLALAVAAVRIVVCIPAEDEVSADAAFVALAQRAHSELSQVPVHIARPHGRYVAGEESALVSWLNGCTGLPSFRLDKALPLSIGRSKALVHNAETLAHVALIARHGAQWFRQGGSENCPGTCLVTVSGTVEHAGVYEIPMGTPILSAVERAMPTSPPAAVLVGGYGGAWLAGADMRAPYSQRALLQLGASTGPGVLVAIDSSVCPVAETARIAAYMAGESAGQCGPCVFGLPAIAEDLWRAAEGVIDPGLARRLRTRLAVIEGRGACAHPDGVVRMSLSALRAFREDFGAHLAGRPCPGRQRASVLRFPDGLPHGATAGSAKPGYR